MTLLQAPLTTRRLSVVIIINALHSGGAEKSCIELARFLVGLCDLHVIALLGGGPAERELRDLGIKVTVLGAYGVGRQVAALWRLAQLLREHRPRAVLTFLYLSDLFGGLLARTLIPHTSIYWNIRNNRLSHKHVGLATYAAFRLSGWLARIVPDEIVYCSPIARAEHEKVGYRGARTAIVENSAASVPFGFDSAKRAMWRSGRPDRTFIFLFVGRFDPVKRVDLFIDACAEAAGHFSGDARFLIAGRGMDASNLWLQKKVAATGMPARFELLGHIDDRQALYSVADCVIVTSESEGSPNVVYEAIATGLQTLILGTVGTENILAPTVLRIPTRRVQDLAEAMRELLRRGPPSRSPRPPPDYAEHPLVAYYKTVLPFD